MDAVAPPKGSVPTKSGGSEAAESPDGPLPEEEFGKQAAARAAALKGLGPRRGERKGRRGKDGPPPLLEGQVVSLGAAPTVGREPRPESQGKTGTGEDAGKEPRGPREPVEAGLGVSSSELDPGKLGLPTDGAAVISYLTNSYKGVGKKTAESLVEAFGSDLFSVLEDEPDRIGPIVSGRRADMLLEGWRADFKRRSERVTQGATGPAKPVEEAAESVADSASVTEESTAGTKSPSSRRRTRRGGRSRRG